MKKNKIRILYISDYFDNSCGSGIIARNTYEIMKSKNYEVEFYTTKGRNGECKSKYECFFPDEYNTPIKYVKNIFKYYQDKIIIIISHRLDNMDLYNKVINIEEASKWYKKIREK